MNSTFKRIKRKIEATGTSVECTTCSSSSHAHNKLIPLGVHDRPHVCHMNVPKMMDRHSPFAIKTCAAGNIMLVHQTCGNIYSRSIFCVQTTETHRTHTDVFLFIECTCYRLSQTYVSTCTAFIRVVCVVCAQ